MKFTVFGGTGFIGSSLAHYLRLAGHEVCTPARDEKIPKHVPLGHVVYAIGMTGNFRQFQFETVDAHVSSLLSRLKDSIYDSWLFLSSTRVYGLDGICAKEQDKINVFPDADGIYDISKLLGESICLSLSNPKVRVARLSNVYGVRQSPHTFLGSLISASATQKILVINEDAQSSKDYVSIEDVMSALEKIATTGQHRIYNLASGASTTHEAIAQRITKLSGISILFAENASKRVMTSVDISLIKKEFGFKPRSLINDLGKFFVRNL